MFINLLETETKMKSRTKGWLMIIISISIFLFFIYSVGGLNGLVVVGLLAMLTWLAIRGVNEIFKSDDT